MTIIDQQETDLHNSSILILPTRARRTLDPEHQEGYLGFPPIRAARANLVETKTTSLKFGGEMSAKRLAVLVVPILVLVSSAFAQVNEVSATAGRTFVSTLTVPSTGLPIHFGNPASFALNYGRVLKNYRFLGLRAELPVGIYPRMNLNYYYDQIPKNIGAAFVTPSLRVNIFPEDSVTPWLTAGGGYGRLWESSSLNFYGANPGSTGTNTGVVQFGAGLDTWFWHSWGVRFEARDFYSGAPDFNVDTGKSRQHNFYVGAGILHRF
jgi:hypothetical protein